MVDRLARLAISVLLITSDDLIIYFQVNSEANARRISNVEHCFGSSGQPLAIPGRVLVGEGVLVKICRKKPKTRQFFLFNDILVYGNIVISKRKFNKQHIIPLDGVRLDNLEDEGELRNGWLIKTPTKSFAVYAATSSEKREWMIHIERCVVDLLAKSGKTAATVHAAVWIPDSEAAMCMHCEKVQFNVFQRRVSPHHCRKCGLVVCGSCSNKRFLLPHQSNKPLRVCLTCFQKLTDANKLSLMTGSDVVDSPGYDHENAESSGEEDSSDEDENKQTFPIHETPEPTFYDSTTNSVHPSPVSVGGHF
ncbi:Pleckstrin homology domain-containing family F member 2 [Trichinella nelsoni]|uniref:Pleckstrin homology domain-containing family F member 2 n=1 Tax=Trichinella nelsoni TaxID=6336 RepID=A0A0V0RSM4_9BILA|nr:Pleckstrin homology domain-containing family F member 2 [Trichinella nelsoni]